MTRPEKTIMRDPATGATWSVAPGDLPEFRRRGYQVIRGGEPKVASEPPAPQESTQKEEENLGGEQPSGESGGSDPGQPVAESAQKPTNPNRKRKPRARK